MRKRRLVVAAAFLGVSLALALPAAVQAKGGGGGGSSKGGGAAAKPPEKPKPYKVGDVVRDLSIDLLDGGKWSPGDASGKTVVLLFGGKDKLGEMRKAHELLKGREDKVVVVGVLVAIPADKAKEDVKAEKEKIETTLGVDPKKEALARFTTGGAESAILGPDGKLVFLSGSCEVKAVEKKLDELVKPPAKADAKPGDKPPPGK